MNSYIYIKGFGKFGGIGDIQRLFYSDKGKIIL